MENLKLSVAFYTSGLVTSLSQTVQSSTSYTDFLVPADINSFQILFDEFLSDQSQDILQHVSKVIKKQPLKHNTLRPSKTLKTAFNKHFLAFTRFIFF